MAGYTCPYCQMVMALNSSTYSSKTLTFGYAHNSYLGDGYVEPVTIRLTFFRCPNCNEISVNLKGDGAKAKNVFMHVLPQSSAKQFPDYIPLAIRRDYEEACAIVNLSPKASATLSRRCLQGMIHDFWDIHEKNLNAEITSLKDKMPAEQWDAIDALRKIGNISAHMSKDVNSIVDIDEGECDKLLQLIEFLLNDWYVQRHNRDKLFAEITAISDSKTS